MITIYTTAHCPVCKKVQEYFNSLGAEYHTVNIEEDSVAQSKIANMGFMSVPVVEIDGKYVNGFNRVIIDELLENHKNIQ